MTPSSVEESTSSDESSESEVVILSTFLNFIEKSVLSE